MTKIALVERNHDIGRDPEPHPSTAKRSPEITQNRHRLRHKISIKSGTLMIIRKETEKVLPEINPIIIQMEIVAVAKTESGIIEKVEPKIDQEIEIVRSMIDTVRREAAIKPQNIETVQEIENGKFLVGNY